MHSNQILRSIHCHKLVCHCLLGEKDDASYLLKNVKEAIYRRYKLSDDKAGFYEWDIKLFWANERKDCYGTLQKPRGHV